MSEVMQLRGRLATAQELTRTLEIGLDTDICELRTLADKYEEKTDLRAERIVVIAHRIEDQVKGLRKLKQQINDLKKDLGE